VIGMQFRDRMDAGRRLADAAAHLRGTDPVVLGRPRGGVLVAFEVARYLGALLDVVVVCEVGVPWQPGLAMGAVGEDGVKVVDDAVVRATGVEVDELAFAKQRARAELARRVATLRRGYPRVPLAGRTVVIVDEGMATGSTARAACQVARIQGAARVVLAVPVAAAEVVAHLSAVADEVVCLLRPGWFQSLSRWYDDVSPTTDDQIIALLDLVSRPYAGRRAATGATVGTH
jgi:putative phosphoribosyl transferase